MPKFVIEREIPGVGRLPAESMRSISKKSCEVLEKMGPSIQWVESFVTNDKLYCVYIAPDEEAVRQHAAQGGFPANRISAVKRMIDPTTAE
jgi:hypothetical protein